LIFPDGSSLRFPGLPGTSPSGEAGLPGSVDNHLPTVFGSALVLSLLSAGVQLSQPQQSATFGQAASAGQIGAAALGQELSTVSTEILRRGLAIAPTLRIPSGTEFEVFVRADLALHPYR
jgi:type IV secretion system protein VirB10